MKNERKNKYSGFGPEGKKNRKKEKDKKLNRIRTIIVVVHSCHNPMIFLKLFPTGGFFLPFPN